MRILEIVRARDEEFDDIVELFRAHDFALKERAWFDWKHLRNPFGVPHLYKLIADGELAGTVGLLAQPFRLDGRALTAVQAVDGLMGRAIRGKGLFNDVMAFVVDTAPDGIDGPRFGTGFASLPGSMKALENAGWQRLARFRVRKALLSTSSLRSLPGGAVLSRLLAPFWSLARSLLFAGADRDLEVVEVTRFEVDLDRFQPAGRVCGGRSATFLNWRVFDNPRDEMRAFVLRRGGETVGYVVCKVQRKSWEVVEFRSALPGRGAAVAFLKHLHAHGLTESVDFWLLDGFLQRDRLPRGLLDRGASGAMFVHGLAAAGLPDDPGAWAASYLDSDW